MHITHQNLKNTIGLFIAAVDRYVKALPWKLCCCKCRRSDGHVGWDCLDVSSHRSCWEKYLGRIVDLFEILDQKSRKLLVKQRDKYLSSVPPCYFKNFGFVKSIRDMPCNRLILPKTHFFWIASTSIKMMESSSDASIASIHSAESLPDLVSAPSCDLWSSLVTKDGGKTPFDAHRRMKKNGLDDNDVFDLMLLYDHHLATRGYCFNQDRKRKLQCDCLCVLDLDGEGGILYDAVAEWQMNFAGQSRHFRVRHLIQLMQQTTMDERSRGGATLEEGDHDDTHRDFRGCVKAYRIPFIAVSGAGKEAMTRRHPPP
jgi:hypothetical protein